MTVCVEESDFTGSVDVSGGSGYYNADTGEDHRAAAGLYTVLPPPGGFLLLVR